MCDVDPHLAPRAGPPLVYSAVVDSLIQPVSAEYITSTLDQADLAGAALVVFTLRTPGGLVESTRAIVSHMVTARTPVAIFVAPSGARAASAGFILTIAADVAAMAPGTHIGAAHPVDGGGQKIDETMAAKMTEDLAAYARTLAGRRHRNVTLAAEAVSRSRAFTEEEARAATPPLIDLVAADLPDLLRQLDGRTITRFDGATVSSTRPTRRVVAIEMTLRQRVLSAVANPDVAYLLLSLGTLGLTIELWNPGAVLPGVVGGLCLLLAFFAFSMLPVNVAGVLLLLFGLLLLVLEIKVTSFGLLTVGGVVSLVFGSMILRARADGEVSSYGVIAGEPAPDFGKGVYRVKDLVEKPPRDEAPSDLAIIGRYILTPDIFPSLHATAKDKSGEIQLTNGLRHLLKSRPIYALRGRRRAPRHRQQAGIPEGERLLRDEAARARRTVPRVFQDSEVGSA